MTYHLIVFTQVLVVSALPARPLTLYPCSGYSAVRSAILRSSRGKQPSPSTGPAPNHTTSCVGASWSTLVGFYPRHIAFRRGQCRNLVNTLLILWSLLHLWKFLGTLTFSLTMTAVLNFFWLNDGWIARFIWHFKFATPPVFQFFFICGKLLSRWFAGVPEMSFLFHICI